MTQWSIPGFIRVERALEDVRRGMPVLLEIAGADYAVLAAEEATSEGLEYLQKLGTASFICTAKRASYLSSQKQENALAIPLSRMPIETIAALSGLDQKVDAPSIFKGITDTRTASAAEQAALLLPKLAELLPAVIIVPLPDGIEATGLMEIEMGLLLEYQDTIAVALKRRAEAPLRLEDAENAKIIAYRTALGGREHYAILVGNPERDVAPLVRIHSSCYTGDLLGSLACDCGEQLRSAIALMDERETGGILLYLMQEGRGIGLTNKLRTYALQAQGHDTVDANEILGFEDDERLFAPAQTILKDLGVTQVRLLSNNPRKARGLEALGIKVVECVPHIMASNPHNDAYLKTKAARLGHRFEG
ncbi:MAG: cyclohydrolase [Rickettsiales bacterium]|jgi:GTP cyclohydrolase II|nr:cyclohydrolase [Rickettsiales bacterium]